MTTSSTNTENQKPLILPFQQPVFDRLSSVARACLYVDRRQFSVLKLRACHWLIGPTGSGKTFLAQSLASEMEVPFLALAVSDWIILGGTNRGSTTTWPNILSFLNKHKNGQGAIIFIDELDKCRDQSNWNSFLRSEIFSLCDSRIPFGINDLDDDDDAPESSPDGGAAAFLRDKVMILGGAAFQELWDEQASRGLGFNPAPQVALQPELPDLAKILPRELINRFSSEMFILPQLQENDYCDMLESMAVHVPEIWRARFVDVGLSRIEQAARHQKGVRFLEEVLLTAVVEERAALANFVPDPPIEPEQDEPEESQDLGDF